MTEDPIKDASNWYAYVNNDPVNFVDPNGLAEEGDLENATDGDPDDPVAGSVAEIGETPMADTLDYNPDLKITKRLRRIHELPQAQKQALLKTIDAYLVAAQTKKQPEHASEAELRHHPRIKAVCADPLSRRLSLPHLQVREATLWRRGAGTSHPRGTPGVRTKT